MVKSISERMNYVSECSLIKYRRFSWIIFHKMELLALIEQFEILERFIIVCAMNLDKSGGNIIAEE